MNICINVSLILIHHQVYDGIIFSTLCLVDILFDRQKKFHTNNTLKSINITKTLV